MEAYLAVLRGIALQFDEFELTRIPRGENTSADALAALASTSNPTIRRVIPVEGIDRPRIDLPRRGIANDEDNLPLIGAIITRSRSQRNTQDLEEEELGISQSQRNPGESSWGTRSRNKQRATQSFPKGTRKPTRLENPNTQLISKQESSQRKDGKPEDKGSKLVLLHYGRKTIQKNLRRTVSVMCIT